MKRVLTLACLTIAALAGCDKAKVSDESILTIREPQVIEAMSQPQVVLVDVRKPEHFAKGHLPGAINIYLPQMREGDVRLASAKQIIVYASGWTDPLSPAAAKKLMALGYQNVFEFKGGIEVWTAAGHTLATSATPQVGRPETDR
jgi:rhodanese-related sulfurtransferase